MTSNRESITLKYSREELLNLQSNHHDVSSFDWSHIDNILSPNFCRRIEARITRRLSEYRGVITGKPCNNLIILPTYASITQHTNEVSINQNTQNIAANHPPEFSTQKTRPPSGIKQSTMPGLLLTNCRSLTLDKIDELKLIIEDKDPHVIMLTESWLTDSKESTRLIDHYNLHTSNRGSGRVGGGVALFTHESLNAKVVHKYTTKRFSTIWVKISEKHYSTIYGCIYHPKSRRNSDTEEILRHLSDTMVKLATKHSDRFVIGAGHAF